MDGKKYMAGRMATTWRRALMRGLFHQAPYDPILMDFFRRTHRPPPAPASFRLRIPADPSDAPRSHTTCV